MEKRRKDSKVKRRGAKQCRKTHCSFCTLHIPNDELPGRLEQSSFWPLLGEESKGVVVGGPDWVGEEAKIGGGRGLFWVYSWILNNVTQFNLFNAAAPFVP
jgi:hypothetical protein